MVIKSPISVEVLWSNILSNNNRNQLTITNKRVVVLGDNLTGRRTLISKLISNDQEPPYRGHGLNYQYINISGKDDEDVGCLSFITIDPCAPLRAQFSAAIPDEAAFKESLILICVDFSRPWAVMESLQKWIKEIRSHRDEWLRIPARDINVMNDDLQEKWLKQSNLETLEGCILENSLGCEILVVGLKSDVLQPTLNEEGMTEQHADLLQFQLRTEALKLGSALFYCSVKETRTVETLKAYILNTLFCLESDQLTARGVSREALFIPMGWDNEKRIHLLKEGPELPATIVTPRLRGLNSDPNWSRELTNVSMASGDHKPQIHEQELTADDEQQSLLRVEQLLEHAAQQSSARGVSSPATSAIKNPLRPAPTSAVAGGQLPRPSVPTPTTKISANATPGPGSAGSQANERMLADFFNQLLLKNGPNRTPKPNQTSTPGK